MGEVELSRSRKAACAVKGDGDASLLLSRRINHTDRLSCSRDAGCPYHLPGQTWTRTRRGTSPPFLQFTNGLRVTHSCLFDPQGVLRLLLDRWVCCANVLELLLYRFTAVLTVLLRHCGLGCVTATTNTAVVSFAH